MMNTKSQVTDQVRLPSMSESNSRKAASNPATKAANNAALAMLMAMRAQYV
jgi:hypothetical protein